MRSLCRILSLALIFGLLAPLLAEAQIIGKTRGRRKPKTPPPAAVEEDLEEAAPVIGPMVLSWLPVPLVIPIGDRKHPPGAPFNAPGQPVAGGEFHPRGLIAGESGEPGALLDDYLVARHLVTRRQYQIYLVYLDVFEDHSHCHPFEPLEKDHRPEGWYDLLACEDPGQPITGIDWFDAYGFAAWAGARLATDLEWERAGLSAPAGEWSGSWYSSEWLEDPEAIRDNPRGPAGGTVTDGPWTFHQSMTVREVDGSRSWRNIYARSLDLGFRLAWSPPPEEEPAGGDVPANTESPGGLKSAVE